MSFADKKVVICGGGIIGCSVAYHLAKKGVPCTVVEATGIASAASGKAGGFLARDWSDGSPVGEMSKKSFDLHMELSKEFTDCDYRRLDTLAVTARDGHSRKVIGSCPDWLEKNIDQVSTLGSTQDTAQVHPSKLCHAFFRKAEELVGSTLHIGHVEELVVEGDEKVASGVRLRTGEVLPADVIVLALGPWTSKQRSVSVPRVDGHKAASIVIQPEKPVTPHALFVTLGTGRNYEESEWYPRPDGTLYVCSQEQQPPLPEQSSEVLPSSGATDRLKATIQLLAPQLGMTTVAEQACYLPVTEDGIPMIGKLSGTSGVYIATGHSVWGILNAPATGAALAELIVDGKCTILDLDKFNPARF